MWKILILLNRLVSSRTFIFCHCFARSNGH